MKTKKILSVALVSAMLSANAFSISAGAAEESNSVPVDISGAGGNVVMFQYIGNDYQSLLGERSIAAEGVEKSSKYNKDMGIFTVDEVRFNIGKDLDTDSLYFRTDQFTNGTFEVLPDYYSEIAFLGAAVTDDGSDKIAELDVTVKYTDNSEEKKHLSVEFIGNSSNAAYQGKECYSNEGVVANRGWNLTLHKALVAVDSGKNVKSITIPKTSGAASTIYVLAITAVKSSDEEFKAYLETEISKLPQSVSSKSELSAVTELIENAKKRGIDIDTVSGIEKYRKLYYSFSVPAFVDLSGKGTSYSIFATTDSETVDSYRYLNAGDITAGKGYDKDTGVITLGNNEYYLGTDLLTKNNYRNNGSSENTFEVEDGYYKNVSILGARYDKGTQASLDYTITYTDDSTETGSVTLGGINDSEGAVLQAREIKAENGENVLKGWNLSLHETSFNVRADKKVDKITFAKASSSCVYVVAVTFNSLTMSEVGENLEKVLDELPDSISDLSEISFATEMIKYAEDMGIIGEYDLSGYFRLVNSIAGFETVDLSDYTNKGIFTYADSLSPTTDNYLNASHTLSATKVEESDKYNKESGIFTHNGIGYNIKNGKNTLEGKTAIGTNGRNAVKVSIPKGKYSTVNLLAATGYIDNNSVDFVITYDDGLTETKNVSLRRFNAGVADKELSTKLVTIDGTTVTTTNYNGGLNEFKIPVDIKKNVTGITIPKGDVIVAAVTAVKVTNTYVEKLVEEKISELESYTFDSTKEIADLIRYGDTIYADFSGVLNINKALDAIEVQAELISSSDPDSFMGKTMPVELTVDCLKSQKGKGYIAIIVLKNHGKFFSVKTVEGILGDGGVNTSISVPQTENADFSMEIYLWNNAESMKPMLKKKLTFEKTYGYDALIDESKDLTVCYFGDSQTEGGKYSSALTNLLTESRTGKVTAVTAGLGGTASHQNVYRIKKDVLAYKPDVVFVEFTPNDANWINPSYGLYQPERIEYATEGIIRELLKAEHEPVIIYMNPMCRNIEGARKLTQEVVSLYKSVLKNYGDIGLIDFDAYAEEMATLGNKEYELSNLTGSDNVHFTAEGGRLCAEYIFSLLNGDEKYNYIKRGAMSDVLVSSHEYVNPDYKLCTDGEYDENWANVSEDITLEGYGTPVSGFDNYMQTVKNGAEMTFEFYGDTIGFMTLLGSNGSSFSYSIDDGVVTGEGDTVASSNTKYKGVKLLKTDLPEGKHTITITNTGEDGKELGFAYFFVDEK